MRHDPGVQHREFDVRQDADETRIIPPNRDLRHADAETGADESQLRRMAVGANHETVPYGLAQPFRHRQIAAIAVRPDEIMSCQFIKIRRTAAPFDISERSEQAERYRGHLT